MPYIQRRIAERRKAHAIAVTVITAQCIGLTAYGAALAFIAYVFGTTL